jgi:hypothetical protein
LGASVAGNLQGTVLLAHVRHDFQRGETGEQKFSAVADELDREFLVAGRVLDCRDDTIAELLVENPLPRTVRRVGTVPRRPD